CHRMTHDSAPSCPWPGGVSPMRIFLTIPASPEPTLVSSLWRANLCDPLIAMGHDVVTFEHDVGRLLDADPARPGAGGERARFTARWREALDAAQRDARIDLLLTYVSASHLDADTVRDVSRRIAPVVGFFCNNAHQFHLLRPLAP